MNLRRPQRYLLMILSSVAVSWTVLRLLPWRAALAVGLVVLIAIGVMAIGSRHLLIGRYRARRRDWRGAIESYQRFERMLLTHRLATWLAPFHLGIYTLDGVARARNLIAEALLHLDKLDEAEGWLRSSLRRDPLYPVPYTNLGTIEALRSQDELARRHFQKAVDLGFSPAAAQQLFNRARQRARSAKPRD